MTVPFGLRWAAASSIRSIRLVKAAVWISSLSF